MISKRVEGTIAGWLTKREDLFEEERQAFIEYVRDMSNVEALATGRWFSNGVVRVPEDQPKVSQAIKVAKIAKVDPLQYKSPMELIDKHASIKLKGEPIDPHTISTLHKVREFPEYGIEIFDVEDGEESRQNMREIINTHFGVNSNPWCLLQGDGEGNLTEKSKDYWEHYNGYPKQVAFVNGKLNSFSANDFGERIWWDRTDVAYKGINFVMKVPNDDLERNALMQINAINGELKQVGNLFRGNKQNGLYEEWHENGQMKRRYNYKDGKWNGLWEKWYEDGQMSERRNYKDDKVDGLWEEWHKNGQMKYRINYKDDQPDGLYELWYANGQLRRRGNYKDGRPDGLWEEWYKNGQKKERCNYKDGKSEGLSEEWYENGQLKERLRYKDDKVDGLWEEWYANGQLWVRCNYKDGQLDGLSESWDANGEVRHILYYKFGELIALGKEALATAQKELKVKRVKQQKK